MSRRIVQFAMSRPIEAQYPCVMALADDGTLWWYDGGSWEQWESLPAASEDIPL